MKIEILKTKKNFKKGGFHTNPNVSWEVLLFIALILILLSFVFGFYLFRQINKEFILSDSENNSQTKVIKKERIQKVLEYFSERQKKSAEMLNSPAPIVDPSL